MCLLNRTYSAIAHKANRLHLKQQALSHWTCTVCGKVLLARRNLVLHMRTHVVPVDPLNEMQRQLLYGSLLGDGSITHGDGTYVYRESHKIEHQDYLRWKVEYFGPLVSSLRPNIRYDHVRKLTRWHVRMTMCGNWLKPYHELFYPNGHKIIPSSILSGLSSLAFAVWFCDDGTKASTGKRVRIHADDFTIAEANAVTEILSSKFHIASHVSGRPHRPDHPILNIDSASATVFVNMIKPYIVPCMQYKITPIEKRRKADYIEFRKPLHATAGAISPP